MALAISVSYDVPLARAAKEHGVEIGVAEQLFRHPAMILLLLILPIFEPERRGHFCALITRFMERVLAVPADEFELNLDGRYRRPKRQGRSCPTGRKGTARVRSHAANTLHTDMQTESLAHEMNGMERAHRLLPLPQAVYSPRSPARLHTAAGKKTRPPQKTAQSVWPFFGQFLHI